MSMPLRNSRITRFTTRRVRLISQLPNLTATARKSTHAVHLLQFSYENSRFLIDGLHPSDTFCRLAEALFRQLTPSEFVDPLALARADDPNIRNVELVGLLLSGLHETCSSYF